MPRSPFFLLRVFSFPFFARLRLAEILQPAYHTSNFSLLSIGSKEESLGGNENEMVQMTI